MLIYTGRLTLSLCATEYLCGNPELSIKSVDVRYICLPKNFNRSPAQEKEVEGGGFVILLPINLWKDHLTAAFIWIYISAVLMLNWTSKNNLVNNLPPPIRSLF